MANTSASPTRTQLVLRVIIGLLLGALVLGGVYTAYAYIASPEHVRKPTNAHYHFRMQVLVDGKAEDFGSQEYQKGYPKDLCNAALVEQPIHFHDNKDQFVHIHWKGVTGGEVLKYYGWNLIGGLPSALGYKLDDLGSIEKVTAHGNYLPKRAAGTNYYVYTGDENGYQERKWEDFLNQDLEAFFGKSYGVIDRRPWIVRMLAPKANAHADPADADGDGQSSTETTEERLTRINTLVGNVVVFAQKDRPTDEQIKDRFTKLVPLSDSTCGG